ncbi:MAG: hypothetical protein ABI303_01850 [Candidatus Saccharimonas sp.]
MIIQTRRKLNKKLLLSLIAVLAVGVLVWLYSAYHFQNWPFLPPTNTATPTNTINNEPPKPDQVKAGNVIKEKIADQAKSGSQDTNLPPGSSTQSPTVDISITNTDTSNGALVIHTLIQKVTSTGSCTLTMSGPNGGSYTATAEVQAMPSSSTCKGFNVPLSGLAHGKWQIKINFVDGTDSGSVSQEVTL